jgi:hypothetical protein
VSEVADESNFISEWENRVDAELVLEKIARINPNFKELPEVIMAHLSGWTWEEIRETFGLKESAAALAARWHRIKQRIREQFGTDDPRTPDTPR